MESGPHISTGAIPKSKFINMQKELEHMDTMTSTYLNALNQEIKSNENEQIKLTAEVRKIQDVIDQLKKLAEQPEWPDSFVQVNPLAYIPATIIHTGEHHVKLGPDTYSLMSLKETVNFLQRKLEYANKVLDIYKEQQKQLEERNTLPFESDFESADTEGMPLEIASDKGVAHKTAAGFYEVLENYDEEEEKEFYKRRQQNRIKKGKQKKKLKEEADDYLARLDELQTQEELGGELEENIENQDIGNKNISEKVKIILRQSGLYNMLLNDSNIRKYCLENKTALELKTDESTASRNESVLNELIVEALINVPNYTDEPSDDISNFGDKSDYDFHESISKNDLVVSDFLDNIEYSMKQWNL